MCHHQRMWAQPEEPQWDMWFKCLGHCRVLDPSLMYLIMQRHISHSTSAFLEFLMYPIKMVIYICFTLFEGQKDP